MNLIQLVGMLHIIYRGRGFNLEYSTSPYLKFTNFSALFKNKNNSHSQINEMGNPENLVYG